MSSHQIKLATGLILAAALAVSAAPALGQTTVSYPPSRSLGDVAVWLRRETPLAPEQVVDVNPSAVTAITAAAPMGETRGFLASIASEALDPAIVNHDGIASWSLPVEIDCDRRMARLGVMTGYNSRDLRSEGRIVREADTNWFTPGAGAPLVATIRALCDRDFHRPFSGKVKVAVKTPDPPATAAPRPAPRPTLAPARPQPAKAVAPAAGAVSVQVGASPSLPDINGLLTRFNTKFAGDLGGLSATVATVQSGGKTVNRALISGFRSSNEANAFCKKLTAARQACFIRR